VSVFCAPPRFVYVRGFGAVVVLISGGSLLHVTPVTGFELAVEHAPVIFLVNVSIALLASTSDVNLQHWDTGCHDSDSRLCKRPNREIDTIIGDVCAGHADHHDCLDNSANTGAEDEC
jgi:hypothetical protein